MMSILFYALWKWEFSLLMLFSGFLDYFISKRIYQENKKSTKKSLLLISLVINIGLLLFFKYTYFFIDNINLISNEFGAAPLQLPFKIILPLGISFYTFQTISYSIDVYRGVSKPIDNIVNYLVYVTFWPQLVAGPILRANEILPQLNKKPIFSSSDISVGFERIIIGLTKKVFLADNIGIYVDQVFSIHAGTLCAWDIIIGTFLFGFQIYFYFAGYSDIAIGSARLIGIKFPENFNWPYIASSPKSFWKRWHISLSSWIRDYLYLPLAGVKFRTNSEGGIGINNKSSKKLILALFLTWAIMGFWHGSKWKFVIWGIYYSLLVYAHRKIKLFTLIENYSKALSWCIFFPLLMISWLPFRANSLNDLSTYVSTLFSIEKYDFALKKIPAFNYYLLIALILAFLLIRVIRDKIWKSDFAVKNPFTIKIIPYSIMIYLIIVYLKPVTQFIYFQF